MFPQRGYWVEKAKELTRVILLKKLCKERIEDERSKFAGGIYGEMHSKKLKLDLASLSMERQTDEGFDGDSTRWEPSFRWYHSVSDWSWWPTMVNADFRQNMGYSIASCNWPYFKAMIHSCPYTRSCFLMAWMPSALIHGFCSETTMFIHAPWLHPKTILPIHGSAFTALPFRPLKFFLTSKWQRWIFLH